MFADRLAENWFAALSSIRERTIMNITDILDTIKGSFAIIVPVSLVLSGCATIVHGSHQEIEISSSPVGAKVRIDDTEVGTTPLSVKLQRSEDHIISVGIEGYEEAELKVTNHVTGWVCGNLALIVVFAPVGIAIDFISGGFFAFSVDQVYVKLVKRRASDVGRTTEDERTEVVIGENTP